jgi:hypothetical protein
MALLFNIHHKRDNVDKTECGKYTGGLSLDKWSMVTCLHCLRSKKAHDAKNAQAVTPETKAPIASTVRVLADSFRRIEASEDHEAFWWCVAVCESGDKVHGYGATEAEAAQVARIRGEMCIQGTI